MSAPRLTLRRLWPASALLAADDAGRTSPLRAMRELRGAPSQQDPRIERLMEQATSLVQSAMPRWVPPVFGIAIALGSGVTSVLTGLAGGRALMWPALVAYVLAVALPFGMYTRRRMRAISPELCTLFIQEGICPACGYNLCGVEARDGGYTCPECGDFWLTSRVLRAAPIETTNAEFVLRAHARRGFRSYLNNMDRRTAKDDAGRPFTVARSRMLRRIRKDATGQHLDALDAFLSETELIGCLPRLLAGGLFLLFGALSGGIAIFMSVRTHSSLPIALWGLLPALGFILPGVAVLMSDFGRSKKRIITTLRQLGLCPCCGQRIDDLPADDKGLVHCPTCLRSWNVGDAGNSHP